MSATIRFCPVMRMHRRCRCSVSPCLRARHSRRRASVVINAGELRAVRYRFHGRERSAATGLASFRMRWYDPVTGRWLSKDPIGLSGGLNLYAFCDGCPLNSIDSLGLCSGGNVPIGPTGGLGPARPGPSGNTYYADATGHGVNPDTGTPYDPHIHQRPRKGPDRMFNLDKTPRDGGSKLPKRDFGAFGKAVMDVLRRTGGRLTVPIMLIPSVLIEPGGRQEQRLL